MMFSPGFKESSNLTGLVDQLERDLEKDMLDFSRHFPSRWEMRIANRLVQDINQKPAEGRTDQQRQIVILAGMFRVTQGNGVVWAGKGRFPNGVYATSHGRLIKVHDEDDGQDEYCEDVTRQEICSQSGFCFYSEDDRRQTAKEIIMWRGQLIDYATQAKLIK